MRASDGGSTEASTRASQRSQHVDGELTVGSDPASDHPVETLTRSCRDRIVLGMSGSTPTIELLDERGVARTRLQPYNSETANGLSVLDAMGTVRSVVLAGDSATPAPAASPAPATRSASRSWRTVASWSGEGVKTTEKFEVGEDARISWRYSGDSTFSVLVYKANGDLEALVGNVDKPGSDVSALPRAGRYYITVNAGGPWSIEVQEK